MCARGGANDNDFVTHMGSVSSSLCIGDGGGRDSICKIKVHIKSQ